MMYFNNLGNNVLEIVKLLENIVTNGIEIKNNFWESVIVEGSGGFFGAFFAFIFGLFTLWVQKRRECFTRHKNAVVELEYLLNDHLNDIAKNSYLIKHEINILKKKHLTYNRLHNFRLPTGLELRFGDLEIINRYFSYRESITRLNIDFSKINAAFDNLTNFALLYGRNMDEGNFIHLIKRVSTLDKLLDSVLDETKNLLAFARIYLRRLSSFKEKKFNIYKLNGYSFITEKEIEEELKVLNREINQTMRESRESIKKALEAE